MIAPISVKKLLIIVNVLKLPHMFDAVRLQYTLGNEVLVCDCLSISVLFVRMV